MAERDACERRVYRLALLLTGDPDASERVVAAVVDAQPDLDRLDSAHLDRLTVLRARERRGRRRDHAAFPDRVGRALLRLPRQVREAWIFTRVYRTPDRAAAKATDCSVTALRRHVEQADRMMAKALGGDADAVAAQILQHSMRIDLPPGARARRAAHRRRRRLTKAGLGLAAVIALAGAAWWAWTTFGERLMGYDPAADDPPSAAPAETTPAPSADPP